MEILISWLSSLTETTLCASTSMTNQELFSTWSETPYQVRLEQHLLYCSHCLCRFLRLVFVQVFWSMARLLETRKSPLTVSLTRTFTALASPTGLWGWGWRWTQSSSQCTRTARGSNCCGLRHHLWKVPSKWNIHFSQSLPWLHHH